MTDTFSGIVRGNCKVYPQMTGISGMSNCQIFQNWRYISVLPTVTARLRNFQKFRLPYTMSFAWFERIWICEYKFMHQYSAGLQTMVPYESSYWSIDTEVVWQLWKPGMHLQEKLWPTSCESKGLHGRKRPLLLFHSYIRVLYSIDSCWLNDATCQST
jgi:hypothetical protein